MRRFTSALLLLLSSHTLQALIPTDINLAKTKLFQQYQAVAPELEHNDFGIPVSLASTQHNNVLQGEVISVIDHPFTTVHQSLVETEDWCNTLILHLNTKACTYETTGELKLHVFSGRKFYQSPEQATRLSMDFKVIAAQDDYLSVQLEAAKGPLGTKNYRIQLDATPLPGSDENKAGSTLIRLTFSYQMNWLSKRAMNLYLNTLGQQKVGFTVVDRVNGEPVYIQGVQGIIERNTMRYYLAIKTRLEAKTRNLSMDQQFALWFDAKQRYPLQLNELNKTDYLQSKAKELENQRQEQQKLNL